MRFKSELAAFLCAALLFTEAFPAWAEVSQTASPVVESLQEELPGSQQEDSGEEYSQEYATPSEAELISDGADRTEPEEDTVDEGGTEASLTGESLPREEASASNAKPAQVVFQTEKGNFTYRMKKLEEGYLKDLEEAVYYEGGGVFRLCKDLKANITFSNGYAWELRLDGHKLTGIRDNSVIGLNQRAGELKIIGSSDPDSPGQISTELGTVEDSGGIVYSNGQLRLENLLLGDADKTTVITHKGGAICSMSRLELDGVEIVGFKALDKGSAIYNEGELTVQNTAGAYGLKIRSCSTSGTGREIYNAEDAVIRLEGTVYGTTGITNAGKIETVGEPGVEQACHAPVENVEGGNVSSGVFADRLLGNVTDLSGVRLLYTVGNTPVLLENGKNLLAELGQLFPSVTSYYLPDDGRKLTAADVTDRTEVKNRRIMPAGAKILVSYETGCTEVSLPTESLEAGTILAKPEVSRYGYSDAEWYTDADLTEKYDFSKPLWADICLYAKWIAAEDDYVTVSFDSDGGNTIPTQKLKKGEKATRPPVPTRSGFDFVCWLKEDGSKYDFNLPVEENIKLKAKWNTTYFPQGVGTFYFLNGQPAEVRYTIATCLTKPADPVLTGYQFMGWSYSVFEPQILKFPIAWFSGSASFYAIWKPLAKYTVSFDSMGGSSVEQQSVYEGDKAVCPENPTKTDGGEIYAFRGWCVDEAATKLYDFSTPVKGNLKLYASWVPKSVTVYTVSFDSAGGSSVEQQVVLAGQEASRPDPDPAKELCTFSGWYDDLGQPYDFSSKVNSDLQLTARWVDTPVVIVRVTFETDNGETPKVQTLFRGAKATEPETPAREGYSFTGWYKDRSCTEKFDFSTEISEDLTVYAGWKERKVYTVNFDTAGGTVVSPEKVQEGDPVPMPTDPEKKLDGIEYRFCGWYTDAACYSAFLTSTPIRQNMTLYAKWLEPSMAVVHVSYESNGGSAVPEETLARGDAAHKPADPELDACVFCGWYSDADLLNAYDFSAAVTDDMKLFAKWIEAPVLPVTVTFDYQNGTGTSEEVIISGEPVERPEVNPEKEGSFFTGWYSDESCTAVWDFNTPVYKDTVLYAGYRAKSRYTVSFDSKGGSAVSSQSVQELEPAVQPKDPVKTAESVTYRFCGWYTDSKCTSMYDFDMPVTSDVKLYAKWLEPGVTVATVSFESNGGSAVGSQTVVTGEKLVKPEDPERKPYVFLGWYTDEACTEPFDFDTAVTESMELYAGWELVPVTAVRVLFEKNDGSEPEEQILLQYAKAQQPEDPVRREYFFAGWYADASCTKRYDFDTPVAENTVIYAGWTEKKELTISFDSKGGSSVEAQKILEQDTAVKPEDPTKTVKGVEYIFCYWCSDEDCHYAYDFNRPVAADTTLYAKWLEPVAQAVHVSYDSNGGSEVITETLVKGDCAHRPADPTWEHYTFGGWYTDDTLEEQYVFSTPVTQDIRLYAKWFCTPVTVSEVTFKYQNGAEDKVVKNLNGEPVEEPEEPVYQDHFFMGWYTDPFCSKLWDFRQEIYQDTVLYAGWKAKQIFTVSFDANGGTGTFSGQEVRELDKAEKPEEDPARESYVFWGWCLDPEGKYLYSFDAPVTKDLKLYAKWLEQTVTPVRVEFDSAGGSEVSTQILIRDSAAEKPEDPVRNGYKFICWTKDGLEYDFSIPVTSDIKLKAKWLQNTVIPVWLFFDSQGGSYVEPQLVASGSNAVRPEQDPAKSGCHFTGWYSDRQCTERYDFSEALNKDRIVYAGWNAYAVYTFRFESNGGTAVEPQKITEGGCAVKPADPAREGYTFLFWCKDPQFKQAYDFSQEVRSDTVVYARWIKNEVKKYTVHFDSGRGSTVPDQTVAAGEKATKPADPTRTDYTFKGWFTDELRQNAYDFNTPVTADLKLYAGWTYSGGGGGGGGGGAASGSKFTLDVFDRQGSKIGTWVRNEKGWWIRRTDNTWPADEWLYCTYNGVLNWYYFDKEGYMVSGFLTAKDGKTYYLYESGSLAGAMATGWVQIGGKWYCFNTVSDGTKGAMYVNTTTPDGYRVGPDGGWIP